MGIPWWSIGWGLALSVQRTSVQSLVGELKSRKPSVSLPLQKNTTWNVALKLQDLSFPTSTLATVAGRLSPNSVAWIPSTLGLGLCYPAQTLLWEIGSQSALNHSANSHPSVVFGFVLSELRGPN